MTGFINLQDWPRAQQLAGDLQERVAILTAEALELQQRYADWPEPINRGGWRVHGTKWQGHDLAPTMLARVIAPYGDMVRNAGYSQMLPGAEIAPHVGYSGDVLRMHLGLVVPKGDCAIIVGGERKTWERGGILFFDDTVEHSAHNRTREQRIIVILDLERRLAC